MRLVPAVAFLSLLVCRTLYADAIRQDWVGTYAFSNDGRNGTLEINFPRTRCGRTVSCPLFVQYTDQGNTYPAAATPLDDNGQHLAFTVSYPNGTTQSFDLYMFSADKNRLAGTTVIGGRTLGVAATKSTGILMVNPEQNGQPGGGGESKVVAKSSGPTVDKSGAIVIHDPDGSVRSKRIGECGWRVRHPDGSIEFTGCFAAITVPRVVLPDPIQPRSGTSEANWLNDQDRQTLSILQSLMHGPQSDDYVNYANNNESPADADQYKQIALRMKWIYQYTDVLSGKSR